MNRKTNPSKTRLRAIAMKDRLIELCRKCGSITEIAKILGISRPSVLNYAEELALDLPTYNRGFRKPRDPERVKRIVALRKEGKTLGQIAKEFGVTRQAISLVLIDHAPDIVISRRITNVCRCCGQEYRMVQERNGSNYCSKECAGIGKRGTKTTRDTILEVMRMRDDGMTWAKIAETIFPNQPSTQTLPRLFRMTEYLMSTEEQKRYIDRRKNK